MSRVLPSSSAARSLRSFFSRVLPVSGMFLALIGCAPMTTPPAVSGAGFAGRMMGGQQPITGATVQLYSAGTLGDGSAATPLITSATVTTSDGSGNATNANANAGNGFNSYPAGSFSITGDYTCPSPGAEVYLVGTGGNPGVALGTNNTAIAMMVALGPCGSLSSATSLVVNEVTTVGSVAALYPYMSSYAGVGSGSSDLSQFQAAFNVANQYVNIAAGASPGPALPNGFYASTATLNSLANSVASCINSTDPTSGSCASLFQWTKPASGSAPTDTIGALIQVLANPTTNAASIYSLANATPPFLPDLASSPTSFALPIVPAPAAPVFSPAAGTYAAAQTVSIVESTPGAAVYYTTDGTTPTTSSSLYKAAINVASSATIKAIASLGAGNTTVSSATYAITNLPVAATPTFSPAAGSYATGQSVTLSSSAGTSIYYTTDGTLPTTASTLYTGAIAVPSSATITAIATGGGYAQSAATAAGYFINQGAGIITTIAGHGVYGFSGDGGPALNAAFADARSVAVDTVGNVYVADYINQRIRKITPDGIITTFAGNGVSAYMGDGVQATSTGFSYPSAVAVDSIGNVFIADTGSSRVRKVTPNGIVATVAGNGSSGYSGDGGRAVAAAIGIPQSIALDLAGNLYIADSTNSFIRKVTPAGIITTIAGTGIAGWNGDGGPATSGNLNAPQGVAVDSSGNVYVADSSNYRIRKITPGGIITTVAGTGTNGFSGDGGPATSAAIGSAYGLAVDTAGNIYFTNGILRKVDSSGVITTIGGMYSRGFSGDGGSLLAAGLYDPEGVAVDAAGSLYIMDTYNSRVRKVTYTGSLAAAPPVFSVAAGTYNSVQSLTLTSTPGVPIYYTTSTSTLGVTPTTSSTLYTGPISVSTTGTISAIAVGGVYLASPAISKYYVINLPVPAGTPTFSVASGTYNNSQVVTIASSSQGVSIYYTTDGTVPTTSSPLYTGPIPVLASETIKAIATGGNGYAQSAVGTATYVINIGIITTVAGNGISGFSGDGGPALNAEFVAANRVAVDSAGNFYVADAPNQRIRKVTASGTITTVAGNGTAGYSGDGGQANIAQLSTPRDVAVDGAGNLYIVDLGNQRIRKVTPAGVISTYAGNGTAGFTGDGGLAVNAELNLPQGIAVDSAGNLYIADGGNGRIRKVTSAGIISTVAGSASGGFGGDGGSATSASLNGPSGVAVDGSANLYIADTNNQRIRKVTSAGIISTIAGNGNTLIGGTGNGGPATSATLFNPSGVAVDNAGNIYIADTDDAQIRKVDSSGIITTVAGGMKVGDSGDGGNATASTLGHPQGVAVDSAGNLYLADTDTYRVRKVSYSNAFTAVAPVFSLVPGTYVAGQSLTITSSSPGAAIYYTLDGSTPTTASALYAGPLTLTASGTVSAIAANGGFAASPVTSAAYTVVPLLATPSFSPPPGAYPLSQTVAISSTAGTSIYYTTNGTTPDSTATLYTGPITVLSSETIKAVAVEGTNDSSTIGTGVYSITSLTPAFSPAAGSYASGQTVTIASSAGTVIYYTTDGTIPTTASTVYTGPIMVSSSQTITAIATGGGYSQSAVGVAGYLINHGDGIINTVAGNGFTGSTSDGVPATSALLGLPQQIAVDPAGNLYIYDGSNYVRKVTPAGLIYTVAATVGKLGVAVFLATDRMGNLYIANGQNYTVDKLTPAGVLTTIAGNGTRGYSGDGGPATSAALSFAGGVAVDLVGNVYISDETNQRIRKVDTSGIISTIAGNGTAGFSGDGGPALSAQLNNPYNLTVDSSGNLYIQDGNNSRIRKVTPSGIISTFAGNGSIADSGDGGPATLAGVSPGGLAADTAGNLYLADTCRIRKVNAAGIISPVVGTGVVTNIPSDNCGFSGDGGDATLAQVGPIVVAVDPAGNLYIADYEAQRIRKVTY